LKGDGFKAKASVKRDDALTKEVSKLAVAMKLHRKGVNFYALQHAFETIAGEARDQVAVDHIMGHARDDIASVYRERISDEQLKAVTDHVRCWLFGQNRSSAWYHWRAIIQAVSEAEAWALLLGAVTAGNKTVIMSHHGAILRERGD
jgi:hypothetical protein